MKGVNKMIPTKTGQIRCFILYCLALSLLLVSLGCSSKDDQDGQEQETAESSTIGENTKSLTEEIAKLKLENNELKKTLADSLAKEKELEGQRVISSSFVGCSLLLFGLR